MCGNLTIVSTLNVLSSSDLTLNLTVDLSFDGTTSPNLIGYYKMLDVDITRELTFPQTVISLVNEGTNIEYTIICGDTIYTCDVSPTNLVEEISPTNQTYVVTCNNLNGRLNVISGCTNPNASNYNPFANFNDGSCYFISGCTIPLADNYNPLAAIDDGSCECSNYDVYFRLDEINDVINITPSSGETCMISVKFKYAVEINCDSITDRILENNIRLTDKLNDLQIDLNLYNISGDVIMSQRIYTYDENLSLYGDEGLCNSVYDLYSFENGLNCDDDVLRRFIPQYLKAEKVFLLSEPDIRVGLNISNFDFDHRVHIDEVEITVFCNETVNVCRLIPDTFGFNLYKSISIKVNDEREYLLNSKEIDLKVSPLYHINNDVIKYFNKYGFYGKRDRLFALTLDEVKYELINVRSRKTDSKYFHKHDIYDIYLSNQESCSLPNNQLEYDYLDAIYGIIPNNWNTVIEPFIDPTLIRNNSTYIYGNNIFHCDKYVYRKYTLDKGCDADVDNTVEIINDDICIANSEYKSRFELISAINDLCVPCEGTGITYSFFDDGISESGRLIQYTGDTFTGITEVINFDTNIFSDCECVPVNIEITAYSIPSKNVLFVEFITSGVNDVSEIKAYVDGVLQTGINTNINFDFNTQAGNYTYTNHQFAIDILIIVENNCGTDSDELVGIPTF